MKTVILNFNAKNMSKCGYINHSRGEYIQYTDHDDRLQSMNEVFIRLSFWVAIVELVLVSQSKLLRKLLLDLLIRHGFTFTLHNYCDIQYMYTGVAAVMYNIIHV